MTYAHLSAMSCVLVAGLCLFPRAKAQTNGGAALTLDEAVRLAKSNNRDLKVWGLDVGRQREALGEAKTHLYPRFDTSVLAAELLTPIDFTIKKGQLSISQTRGRSRDLTPIFTRPLVRGFTASKRCISSVVLASVQSTRGV